MIRGIETSFGYEGRSIVSGSFTLNPGEAVALLAPSGGGKTTLLKGLAGLLKPMAGSVTGVGDWKEVGLVFQNPDDQLFALDVREEMAFGLQNLGIEAGESHERIADALQAVGLAGFEERALHTLSFGEKKRVCLAAVLAMRPHTILLDEPTAGLDPAAETRLTEALLALKGRGIAILAATHAVDWIPSWADRLWSIRETRLVEAPLAELATPSHGLRAPYVTQVWQAIELPGTPLSVEEAASAYRRSTRSSRAF